MIDTLRKSTTASGLKETMLAVLAAQKAASDEEKVNFVLGGLDEETLDRIHLFISSFSVESEP